MGVADPRDVRMGVLRGRRDTDCRDTVEAVHIEFLARQQPGGLVEHILRERLQARLRGGPLDGPIHDLQCLAGIYAYECGR
eukprot:4380469-Pyramimonas_sp.AAC.1